MAASLAESTMRPRKRSSTAIWLFSLANIVDPRDGAPPCRHAVSLTVNCWSSLSLPLLSNEKMMSVVMILAVAAGVMASSAPRSNSTVRVSASMRMT